MISISFAGVLQFVVLFCSVIFSYIISLSHDGGFQLSFSPDDQLLVGVSKDRRISLFEQIPATDEQSSAGNGVSHCITVVVAASHAYVVTSFSEDPATTCSAHCVSPFFFF